MPVSSKKTYTQKEFEKDLSQLEKLIMKGGEIDPETIENDNNLMLGKSVSVTDGPDGPSGSALLFGAGKASDYKGTFRHFKVEDLNGKPVKYDGIANIKEHQTPLNAAKKLLKSICLEHKLKGDNKLKMNATFTIRETTRGSNHKIYGPYTARYHKYTPEEMKKAKAAGQKFRMKPIVKLQKKKTNNKRPVTTTNQKGGKKM